MKNKYILSVILVISVAILLFFLSSFVSDIRRLYRTGVFTYSNSLHRFYHPQKVPATFSDINFISGWMTFNYINQAFSLSPSYLKNSLNISDSSYPNVTISKISAEQKISPSIYLQMVKDAVSKYFTQNTAPQ